MINTIQMNPQHIILLKYVLPVFVLCFYKYFKQ